MRFGRGLDSFIRWFYFSGLSCYPSFDEYLVAKTKNKRFVKYVPTGVLVLLTIITSINNCSGKNLPSYNPVDKSGLVVVFVNTLSQLVTVIVCVIQMVLLSPCFAEICSQISVIERLSWRKLTCNSKVFERRFMRHAYIVLVSFATPILFTLYAKPLTFENFLVTTGLSILRAIVFLALLQAFFYVDLLDHMLQSFVRHVDMRAKTASSAAVQTVNFRSPATKQLTAEIFHFKVLHFNLWEISESINDLFGWTIVVIFLQHFSYAIYNVHYAFTVMNVHPVDMKEFVRKYTRLSRQGTYAWAKQHYNIYGWPCTMHIPFPHAQSSCLMRLSSAEKSMSSQKKKKWFFLRCLLTQYFVLFPQGPLLICWAAQFSPQSLWIHATVVVIG